jgi:hypothetical protein
MTSNCMRSLALALGAAAMAPPLWVESKVEIYGEQQAASGVTAGESSGTA